MTRGSPRCPHCLRRLYDGATQLVHEAGGKCRLTEPEPKHPTKRAVHDADVVLGLNDD